MPVSRRCWTRMARRIAAEFFAVATETFFERAGELASRHPRLYEELRRFYRQDPAAWRQVAVRESG